MEFAIGGKSCRVVLIGLVVLSAVLTAGTGAVSADQQCDVQQTVQLDQGEIQGAELNQVAGNELQYSEIDQQKIGPDSDVMYDHKEGHNSSAVREEVCSSGLGTLFANFLIAITALGPTVGGVKSGYHGLRVAGGEDPQTKKQHKKDIQTSLLYGIGVGMLTGILSILLALTPMINTCGSIIG